MSWNRDFSVVLLKLYFSSCYYFLFLFWLQHVVLELIFQAMPFQLFLFLGSRLSYHENLVFKCEKS